MTSLSLGPHYRGRLGTVLHFARYVSATYPSVKQVLDRFLADPDRQTTSIDGSLVVFTPIFHLLRLVGRVHFRGEAV